jgi:phenylpropionate dioxygenase-like ring-hydroxylating dioxygenase large terminal subunit
VIAASDPRWAAVAVYMSTRFIVQRKVGRLGGETLATATNPSPTALALIGSGRNLQVAAKGVKVSMKASGRALPSRARDNENGLDVSSLVEEGRVHRDVYVDPKVFEAEMQRIFMRMWVYVGHDSEIPQPGDYKTTSIGTEPVILTRDKDEEPRVLVNRCSHRGAAICLLAKGKATGFRCQYHGWTFGLDGALLGVPYSDDDLDKGALALSRTPRVESYRGFIFASFNSDVPALTDHLQDVLPYIDRFVEHAGDHKLQVAPDANEVVYDANWKMQLENNVDGYHLSFTHQSLFGVLQKRTGNQPRYLSDSSENAATVEAFSNGHAVMDLRTVATKALRERLDILPGAPPPGADLDAFFGLKGAEDLYLASTGPPMNISIFPNLNLGSINICEVHPLAVDRTRVVLRPLLLADVPDEINRIRLRYHELGSGPAGFVQPDDLEMFERVGKGLAAEDVEWLNLSRGLDREIAATGTHRIGDIADETPQRGQYRWWRELMSAGP